MSIARINDDAHRKSRVTGTRAITCRRSAKLFTIKTTIIQLPIPDLWVTHMTIQDRPDITVTTRLPIQIHDDRPAIARLTTLDSLIFESDY